MTDGISLTPREEEVVSLLVRGLSQKRIASRLGITRSTVNTYVQRVAAKIPGELDPRLRIIYWRKFGHIDSPT